MAYVEILYARKMFAWFGGIIIVGGILILSTNLTPHVHVHVEGDAPGHLNVSWLFAIAAYGSCVFSTMLAATLNRDRNHLPYIWTRPQSRERIALSYILVDVGMIALAYVLVFAVAVTAFSNVPWMSLRWDADSLISALRYFSIPLMWFGIVEVSTSWNGVKGSMASGFSWLVFWVLLGISAVKFPTPIKEIVAFLNVFNPLAYFTSKHGGGVQLIDAPTHTIALDFTQQAILAYAIAVVAIACAILAWKRMEA